MMVEKKLGRRSKNDWLEAAFSVFVVEGIEGVRVERLARALSVAKSGFYWHFKDRAELCEELLRYWEHEYTKVVTSNRELADLNPADRLLQTAEMILDHDLARWDLPFQAWARSSPEIRTRIDRVIDRRLGYIREIFRELGFSGDDLEMRTRLFVVYHSWEATMFPNRPKAQAKRLIKRRIALLTGAQSL